MLMSPCSITASMKPYQLSGLSFLVWLHNNGISGILGDEMGLGKTLQTLSFFQYLKVSRAVPAIHLVVCPLSVLNTWMTESARFTPRLNVVKFHGPKSVREELKAKLRASFVHAGPAIDVVAMTYEMYETEAKWLRRAAKWCTVVLDEGHKIKNNKTQLSKSLQGISAETRLILTGTPLQNNLSEAWSLLHWLLPDLFVENTESLFKTSFDLTHGLVLPSVMADTRRMLELIMLRRTKVSPGVDLGLPPKMEVVLQLPMSDLQREWYLRVLTRANIDDLKTIFEHRTENDKELVKQEQPSTTTQEQTSIVLQEERIALPARKEPQNGTRGAQGDSLWKRLMNLVVQLRNICVHPYLIPGVEPSPNWLGDHTMLASSKFTVLTKLIDKLVVTEGRQMLIFSDWTGVLDCIEDMLGWRYSSTFQYLRFDGKTSAARRNLHMKLFQDASNDYRIMIISTRAGGLGINLTKATEVVFMDEQWNPQVTVQAESRSHRIRQTSPVTVYKLSTSGTVEEQMLRRIRKKLYLSAKITGSMRNIHSEDFETADSAAAGLEDDDDGTSLTSGELMNLLRMGSRALTQVAVTEDKLIDMTLEQVIVNFQEKTTSSEEEHGEPWKEAEKEWLSSKEKVECVVFEGARYARDRKRDEGATAPGTLNRADRRIGKETTVLVNGHTISKESMRCGDWEAVPTLAGKDPRLVERKREKRAPFAHQQHCQTCQRLGSREEPLTECFICPRVYHAECLGPRTRSLAGVSCPQHECATCKGKASNTGGLLYRCRGCARAFCADDLDWAKASLVGDVLPELKALGYGGQTNAFYICCSRECEGAGVGSRALSVGTPATTTGASGLGAVDEASSSESSLDTPASLGHWHSGDLGLETSEDKGRARKRVKVDEWTIIRPN